LAQNTCFGRFQEAIQALKSQTDSAFALIQFAQAILSGAAMPNMQTSPSPGETLQQWNLQVRSVRVRP